MHGGIGDRGTGRRRPSPPLPDRLGRGGGTKVCGNIETEGGAGRGNNEEWGSG